jgi:hypothetical protein
MKGEKLPKGIMHGSFLSYVHFWVVKVVANKNERQTEGSRAGLKYSFWRLIKPNDGYISWQLRGEKTKAMYWDGNRLYN